MTRLAVIAILAASIACAGAISTPAGNLAIQGTWGGDNAGLIVNLNDVHVHIGCTLGDAVGPVTTDPNGHFEASGTYNVDAYPVNRGIEHPAKFSGDVVGNTMTLTVSLTDTAAVLGPVKLTYGKEPQMGPCPICRVPKVRVVGS
jgi:hypothetical protein